MESYQSTSNVKEAVDDDLMLQKGIKRQASHAQLGGSLDDSILMFVEEEAQSPKLMFEVDEKNAESIQDRA